ncbi:TPA: polyprenol monophosphomannose synthase [Candidatus Woesearchaeota archaeon]|nr:hypothetical protein [uncultured archaeon]MBS3172848.1 polyprenol monophosphomannose synthase [Candidatus Woesearchaeota archaeon]HIH32388.1 polyprenol monophosphomannose synthase [Candidatus Woesearchaeota archaeon]HIH54513.1 polyprenol monophosphomannose synthase [Candidatus Woesearchaeota archaeon]HIJ02265.1 polyprenol monophosphomannose synthase [Candidatus Woesearchaeota archaeon]
MKKSELKLSVIIPTYNEKRNIKILIPRIVKALGNQFFYEIIVVDDNSPDGTAEAVRSMKKKFHSINIIIRKKNRGFANSMIEGFGNAKGRYIATLDSDLCHDPKIFPAMIKILDSNDADMVIGSRYVKGSSFSGKPIIKEMASRTAQLIAKVLLGVGVNDTTNNFRVFKSEIYKKIRSKLHPTGNVMLTEIVFWTKKKGFRIKEIPTKYFEHREDATKIRLGKETIKFIINVFKIRMEK